MKTRALDRILPMLGLLLLMHFFSPSEVCAQRFYQCEEGETADIKVWAAESEREADWCIYFTYDAGDKVGNGVVFQTVKREEADFALLFVDDKKSADVSLWIVEDPSQAGWRNKEKMSILDKFIKRDE